MLIDANKTPIERPKNNKNAFIQAKRRESWIRRKKRLFVHIFLMVFSNGKQNDFRLLKESGVSIHSNTRCLTDTGTEITSKLRAKTRKNPLTKEEKNRESVF